MGLPIRIFLNKDAIEYYYNEDLSLAEISQNLGITRQGVRDAIKRAEFLLYTMEKRIGLAKKFKEMKEEEASFDSNYCFCSDRCRGKFVGVY